MHSVKEWLAAIKLYESGVPVKSAARTYHLDEHELDLKIRYYKKYGEKALTPKSKRSYYCPQLKEEVVRCYLEDCLSLNDVALKYNVTRDRVKEWSRIVRTQGYTSLYNIHREMSVNHNVMGRPRKKKLEEMTELERLRYENEYLKAENALLKKAKALVKEREAYRIKNGQKPSKN